MADPYPPAKDGYDPYPSTNNGYVVRRRAEGVTRVSVLVPAYNGAQLLPATLESILTQEYSPAEVIVVDDGSTDDTGEVVRQFGKHVRYHHTANGGICHARNTAASLASSPYLAFCDYDDLWRKDKLTQQMSLHDENPELHFSFTNFRYVVDGVRLERTKMDDAPADFFTQGLAEGDTPIMYGHSLYESLLSFQPIWPSTMVITREFFDVLGGFRLELGRNPSEDFEFSLRCVQMGPVGVVREQVVDVRRHSSNISRDNEKNAVGQIEVLQHGLRYHLIGESTRAMVTHQIELRRVEASYGAFHRGDFALVVALLSPVPAAYLDRKTRFKLSIARQSPMVAKSMQRTFSKN